MRKNFEYTQSELNELVIKHKQLNDKHNNMKD